MILPNATKFLVPYCTTLYHFENHVTCLCIWLLPLQRHPVNVCPVSVLYPLSHKLTNTCQYLTQYDLCGIEDFSAIFDPGRPKFCWAPKKIDKKSEYSGIDSFSIVLSVANKIARRQHSHFHEKMFSHTCCSLRPRRNNHSLARNHQ